MDQQAAKYFACPDDGTLYDVYDLFQYYNTKFFDGLLGNCEVKWTKKMTRCAGSCKYTGNRFGVGASVISLSEPLLKFRTSNELKQTLLHEMIHAYLFKTNTLACQFQGGHGPAFVQKMYKINSKTGLNITIYHQFHDEVNYYRRHVWKCNGRCQEKPPFYGYIRRSMNRAPQPADYWWNQHKRQCGGQFTKIGEPEKKGKEKQENKKKPTKKMKTIKEEQRDHKSWGCGKTIQEYIKQMQKQKQKKQQKKKQLQKEKKQKKNSANDTSLESTNYTQIQYYGFGIKAEDISARNEKKSNTITTTKTIAQYCLQIQKQVDQERKKGQQQ